MSKRSSLTQERRRKRFRDRGGFTLVEVLVAFTVMATLLSVLFRGVVMMRAGSIVYDDHTRLEVTASALLNDALAERQLASGNYAGVRDGRHWVLIAKPIDLSEQLPPPERDDADKEVAGAPGYAQAAAENVRMAPADQNAKANWSMQRIIVRIETKGRPLEIETVRLVNLKRLP